MELLEKIEEQTASLKRIEALIDARDAELEVLREAFEYMSNPDNWINEDGWLQMKRPGGGGQKGIVLVSHDLNPCTYLSALRAYDAAEKEG